MTILGRSPFDFLATIPPTCNGVAFLGEIGRRLAGFLAAVGFETGVGAVGFGEGGAGEGGAGEASYDKSRMSRPA